MEQVHEDRDRENGPAATDEAQGQAHDDRTDVSKDLHAQRLSAAVLQIAHDLHEFGMLDAPVAVLAFLGTRQQALVPQQVQVLAQDGLFDTQQGLKLGIAHATFGSQASTIAKRCGWATAFSSLAGTVQLLRTDPFAQELLGSGLLHGQAQIV